MSIINSRKKKKEIAPSFYAPRQQYQRRDLSYRIIDRLDNIFISFWNGYAKYRAINDNKKIIPSNYKLSLNYKKNKLLNVKSYRQTKLIYHANVN